MDFSANIHGRLLIGSGAARQFALDEDKFQRWTYCSLDGDGSNSVVRHSLNHQIRILPEQ